MQVLTKEECKVSEEQKANLYRLIGLLMLLVFILGLAAFVLPAFRQDKKVVTPLLVVTTTQTAVPTIIVTQGKKTLAVIGNFPIGNVDATVSKTGKLNVLDVKFSDGGTFTAHFIGELPPEGYMMKYKLGGESYTFLKNTDGGSQKMTEGELTLAVLQGNFTFIIPTKSGSPVKLFIVFSSPKPSV